MSKLGEFYKSDIEHLGHDPITRKQVVRVDEDFLDRLYELEKIDELRIRLEKFNLESLRVVVTVLNSILE